MTEVQRVIATPEGMGELGARLAGAVRAGDVVVLTGPLGAGKTTLTRGLGAALNVRGTVASPTFVIARTHPALGDGPDLIHVDAYRLTSGLELDDLDLDLENSVTIIEWGAEFVAEIADSWLEVLIERPRAGERAASADTEADEDAALNGDESLTAAGDVDEDEAQPRTVTLRAVGDRWADPAILTALLG